MLLPAKYNFLIAALVFMMHSNIIHAQRIFTINADVAAEKIDSTHLLLGGSNAKGDSISVNNFYISYNHKPGIPITGEFHFSRYPEQYWDESLKKMKAGGINTVATYVFWSMHEEHEGVFNWQGNRNLRKFIGLCNSNHLQVIVRIGPFAHGEIRNGALPDWLLGKPVIIRSNDSAYLFYVQRLYREIGKQLSGLYFKEGGPITGIQLENEYQHSAAPWGLTYPGQPYDFTAAERDIASAHEGVSVASSKNAYEAAGNEHMATLKKMAVAAGMDVPVYTVTGWGYAALVPNETLPVTAAYAYPTWTEGKDRSPFFLYKNMHQQPDYSPVRYKPGDYPAFAAELGSGIMTTYKRRPLVPAESMDAMINRCLGSGANGIGYYMYHGGSTPKGDFYFNDEAYGYPKISYDFQAPIGEYGDVREGFQRLKLLNIFCNGFGDVLAPMQTVLPPNSTALKPENSDDLRYAVRVNEGSGFLFLNNFQDDAAMTDKEGIQVKINTSKGAVTIPEKGGFNLSDGENMIFPFHFDMHGVQLRYATAQLLAKSNDENNSYYVFFALPNATAEFSFEKKNGIQIQQGAAYTTDQLVNRIIVTCKPSTPANIRIDYANNKHVTVLVVDKMMAMRAYPVYINEKKYLAFSDALVLQDGKALQLFNAASNQSHLKIYPTMKDKLQVRAGTIVKESDPVFSAYTISVPSVNINLPLQKTGDKKWLLRLPQKLDDNLNDIFINVNYTGDGAMAFINGQLVADEFYKGIPWHIGLKRFLNANNKDMLFYFRPMYKDAPYIVDLNKADIPDFGNENTCLKMSSISFQPEYTTTVMFGK